MLTAFIFAAILASPGEIELDKKLPVVFEKSAAHYRAIDAAASPFMDKGDVKETVPHGDKPHGERLVPHGWDAKNGKLDMRSIYWWTSGHFPGSLWYLYEATGDEFFKEANYVSVDSQAKALLEVKSGTSDAAIIDLLMAGAMIGEGTSYADLAHTVELNSEQYGIGCRKGSDLAKFINDELKKFNDDGSLKQTAEKYGVQAALIEQK